MKISGLTVLMLTPNKVPKKWAEYHKSVLLEAIGDTPIITISKEPLDWGTNLIQTEYGITNIYKQVLRGSKLATTSYIAIADDDTLYPKEHFEYRPPLDKFGYNLNRWHIFTWGKPYYFHKPRPGNGLMIASRELIINALEKRFERTNEFIEKWGNKELGTKKYLAKYDGVWHMTFHTFSPVVSFYHQKSFDTLNQRRRKRPWAVRAYDIPRWGRAEDIRRKFV